MFYTQVCTEHGNTDLHPGLYSSLLYLFLTLVNGTCYKAISIIYKYSLYTTVNTKHILC